MMKMKHGKQMPERKNRRLALEETKNDASLRLQSSKPELDSGTFDFREREREIELVIISLCFSVFLLI